jgi:hypothetical protein
MAEAAPDLTALRQNAVARQAARAFLWQLRGVPGEIRDESLFAILDAARDPGIYPGLKRLARTDVVVPLYEGKAATELAAYAPYLVNLGTADRVFDWIWQEGWGASWGVFFWSLASTEVLRAHFRRLTMVRTETGQRLLFRFYDPRVLPVFLKSCDAGQLRDMYGPIQSYTAEEQAGASIVRLAQKSAVPGRSEIELSVQTRRLTG